MDSKEIRAAMMGRMHTSGLIEALEHSRARAGDLKQPRASQLVVPAAFMAAQTAVAERLVREGVAALRTRVEQAGGRVTIIADEVIIERSHSDTAVAYDIKGQTLLMNWEERCDCGVKGCDPAGVPECHKGIRERRELP